MLFVAAIILVDFALSHLNVRSFVDFLFIEGMAAIIVGSFLVAQSMKPSISMSDVYENAEPKNTSRKAKASHRALAVRILIVGILLVSFAILIGEIWIRRLTITAYQNVE